MSSRFLTQKTWETPSSWTWAAASRDHSMLQLCRNYIVQWPFDLFTYLISNWHLWVNLNHSPLHSHPRASTQVVSSLRFQSSRTSIISKQKGKADLRKTADILQKLQNKIYGKKIVQGEWEWELCLLNLERECHHLQMGEQFLQGAVTRSSSRHKTEGQGSDSSTMWWWHDMQKCQTTWEWNIMNAIG